MDTMIREYLASFLRNLAAPIIVYLASTGYISNSEATNLVVSGVAVAVAVVWGLVNKFLWKKSAATALALPSSTSKTTLNDVIANPKTS